MDTKLTLKLNKKAIEQAKRYAKRRNQSLSGLVENYFKQITQTESQESIEISPNVQDLVGIIELSGDFNLREEYGNHLEEKYSI